MFELITTPKTAIIFAAVAAFIIDMFLTGFLVVNGLSFTGSLIFCTPLAIASVLFMMISGAIVFHIHRVATSSTSSSDATTDTTETTAK